MLKNVLNQRLVLGRVIVVLLFAGGLVFAGTYDGFVAKTEAQASCCGGTDTTTAETSCCGGGTDAVLADGTVGHPEISIGDATDLSKDTICRSGMK